MMTPFYVQPDTFVENENYALPIILGEEDDQLEDVYGLAFSLEYDATAIVPGSATINFDGWVGDLNNDMIAIQKTFVGPGRIDVGLTRIDGLPMAGFGQMGLLFITIEDDVLFRGEEDNSRDGSLDLKFNITNVLVINQVGEKLNITPIETTSVVEGSVSADEVNWDEYIEILPNPVDEVLFINPKGILVEQVELFSISGDLVSQQDARNHNVEINTSNLSPGMYLLKAKTELGLLVRKILVAR